MQLGLVEVNDVKVVVDHKGVMWMKVVAPSKKIYWAMWDSKKNVDLGVYKGHCDMVRYLKSSVYHPFRRIGISGGWVNVRKCKKNKFVEINLDED